MQQANSKCQQVQAGAAQPVVAIAANPQWTCGVIVDGTLSCQQGKTALVVDVVCVLCLQGAASCTAVCCAVSSLDRQIGVPAVPAGAGRGSAACSCHCCQPAMDLRRDC